MNSASQTGNGVKIIKGSKENPVEKATPIIPDTITSKDNLFGSGILSNVVENELDDSEDDVIQEVKLNVYGFPKAAKRPVPEQKITKLPTHDYENGKLEWVSDVKDHSLSDKQNSISIRFSLKGGVLFHYMKDGFIGDALFHHGKDAGRAGYTIQELSHLVKSTMNSQRALALNILTCIVRKFQLDQYTEAQKEYILPLISSGNLLLSTRLALDSNHETVIDGALNFISVFLGLESNIMDAFDEVLLFEKGFRSLALEEFSFKILLQDPKIDRNEVDIIEMNVEFIVAKLVSDSIFGFVLTNIIPRLRFLLRTETLSSGQTIKALHILACVAMHSPSCSEDILACDGLIDILKSFASKCIRGSLLDSSLSHALIFVIRLFRLLSVSSRDACSALLKDGVVDLLSASLSQNTLNPGVCKQMILLFDVNFCYSLGGFLLDKYHHSIFTCILTLVQTDFLSKTGVSPSSDVLSFISAAAKLLVDVINNFGKDLDIGGENDMIAPFADLFSQIIMEDIQIETPDYLILKGNSLKFITSYVTKAMEQQQVSACALKVINQFAAQNSMLSLQLALLFSNGDQENFANSTISCRLLPYVASSFFQLLEMNSLKQVSSYIAFSKTAEFGFAIFTSLLYCAKRNSISKQGLLDICDHAGIRHYLREFSHICLQTAIPGFERVFLVTAFCHFIRAYLNFHDYMMQKYPDDTSPLPEGRDFTAAILCCALPGDDYLLDEVMKKEVGANFVNSRGSLSFTSLQESRRLFGLVGATSPYPSSFLVTCTGFLPLTSFDWIYKFPTELYLEKERLQRYNILEDWLLMIECLEENGSCLVKTIKDSSKMEHLLHVFLIYSKDGHPIFRCGDIPRALTNLFSRIIWSAEACRELDASPSFYSLYQELLDQFLAESFGDETFARMLLLPLSPIFSSSRYRSTFWSKMNGKFLIYFSAFNINQLCQDRFEEIFSICETDIDLIKLYKSLLESDSLSPISALHSILTAALDNK